MFRTTILALALTLMPSARAASLQLDFSRPELVREFRPINDDVMGGVSTSMIRSTDGALVFEGELSLENNGGFASFRGPVSLAPGARGLLLTVRGDGKRYKLTLKLDDGGGTPQYQAVFVAPRDWQTLRFESADFAASFRGRAVSAPRLEFGMARYVGILISDRQAGPFKVELRSIGVD